MPAQLAQAYIPTMTNLGITDMLGPAIEKTRSPFDVQPA
jgi:hypothetical protein